MDVIYLKNYVFVRHLTLVFLFFCRHLQVIYRTPTRLTSLARNALHALLIEVYCPEPGVTSLLAYRPKFENTLRQYIPKTVMGMLDFDEVHPEV